MKRFDWIVLVCLLAAACQRPPQPAAVSAPASTQTPTEQAVAQVGPEVISQQALQERLSQLDKQDQDFATSQVGQRNFLYILIREKLALLDAKEKGLESSPQYQAALQEKRTQLDKMYQQYAQQLLLTMRQEQLAAQGTLEISDEEIAAYHKKYPYEMTIKQIIVDDAQTADQLLKELKYAKNRWKEIERQYSVAPERSRGKEIAFMPGEFIPDLEVIAANSAVGSVQGFIKTTQGFHIIMKTGERRLSLQDAAPRIRTVLENQKEDALFNALQNKYKVVIYE